MKSCGILSTTSRRTLEVTYAFKKLKKLQFENLNDADMVSMPMFVFWNKLFVHEKSRIDICFLVASSQESSVRISHGSENLDFRCWATPIIITSMPMFAMYRAKVKHSIYLVKIVNQFFERQQFFLVAPVPKFWRRLSENQGQENIVLVSLGEFFVHVTVTRVYVWLLKNLFWLVNQTCR